VVVDYGAGNLRSVQRALEAVGQQPIVTSDPALLADADAAILPGVGSANDAMKALRRLGLAEPLRTFAASGRPFLGVCVGLQVFFDWSDEGGGVECLGIIPGTVRRFTADAAAGLKVPHMGWNSVSLRRSHPLLDGVPDNSYFYFVHSYLAAPADPEAVVGATEYGETFPAIVAQRNVAAVQFHPEKSADLGLRLYANFVRTMSGRRSEPFSSRQPATAAVGVRAR
jgi:glutamine amidotransferase